MQSILQGILHITDLQGYDHMLFLLALCAPFSAREYKKVFWLATAFTLGHSLTLALAALDVLRFSSHLIELLIPITIMLTALWNVAAGAFIQKPKAWVQYSMAATFGLIHGMGFSSYFRMLYNETGDLVKQLFLFNLGVELGQIIIICLLLLLFYVIQRATKLPRLYTTYVLSTIAFVVAAYLVYGILFTTD